MATLRDRLAGQDPTRQNLKKRLSQVGNYNLTHQHGQPIGDYNASHVAGHLISPDPGAPTRGGQVPAMRDHALDPTQAGWNRQNAPVGQIPPWVLAQMHAQGVPPGVNPTKPQGPVQGSDALTGLQPAVPPVPAVPGPYPIRRPQVPDPRRRDRSSR